MSGAEPSASLAVLLDVLGDAQRLGFIGAGPLQPHLEHSQGFATALAAARQVEFSAQDQVVDLGSGGGIPGLVLAMRVPSVRLRLVEGSTRRSTFLRAAVERCGFESHVEVVAVRAEVAGRRAELRGGHTVVVSRLFGSPAETAECASPLLGVGGYLVVSEPPSDLDESRWPSAGLDLFGLEPVVKPVVGTSSFAVFRQVRECPERFPRRVGVPGKRPLF